MTDYTTLKWDLNHFEEELGYLAGILERRDLNYVRHELGHLMKEVAHIRAQVEALSKNGAAPERIAGPQKAEPATVDRRKTEAFRQAAREGARNRWANASPRKRKEWQRKMLAGRKAKP